MSVARNIQFDDVSFSATSAGRMLPVAHSQIEKRFLDGGQALLSIMDAIGRLLASLDNLTGSLDDEATSRNAGLILQTAGDLSALPAREQDRLDSFRVLSSAGTAMRAHVDDMHETMRYLRTFAITVKITGAGLAEFAGFAEEIMERIQSGTREVAKFGEALDTLNAQLRRASGFSTQIVDEYAGMVPTVVADLKRNASTIGDSRRRLVSLATQVSGLARAVQNKVATVLSALQIGDITRQRMEHVQQSFALLEAVSADMALIAGRDLAPLSHAVTSNAAAQMASMSMDFRRESQNVVTTMRGFIDDTREMLTLRDAMAGGSNGEGNFLRVLEGSVTSACTLVEKVHKASLDADEVAHSTAITANRLLNEIEVIRAIKTDIHYMALNTNLRCSRLGEAGKSINVVTAELRLYAGRLEISADAVVEQLQRLEEAARRLAERQSLQVEDALREVLTAIREAATNMESHLATLSAEGDDVFNSVSKSIASLDFEKDLGELLDRCADELAEMIGSDAGDQEAVADLADVLGGRIHAIYTMMSEREIHRQFLPAGAEPVVAAAVAPVSDEDLFEDALF